MTAVTAPGGFEIRDAGPNDLDGAAAAMLEAYGEYRPVPLPDEWLDAWEAYRHDVGDVRSRVDEAELLVAIVGELVAGAVTFYPEASRSTVVQWPPGWASIRFLAVSPRWRRRGIGRALSQECVRRARLLRKLAIGLHTDSRMPVPQHLYAQMGFRRDPEFDHHPAPDTDFTVMGWRLDLGPRISSHRTRVAPSAAR